MFPFVFSDLHIFSEGLAKVNWYWVNRGDGFIDKEGYFIGQGFVEHFYCHEISFFFCYSEHIRKQIL